jgi:hypothetical protein
MKAQCATLSLYHIAPGRHREALKFHDLDHKAEQLGSVPGVFVSQRWVTPPEWLALRPPSELRESGGEYVNISWSSGTAEDLVSGFKRLHDECAPQGRMEPLRVMDKVWPEFPLLPLRPILMESRPGAGRSGGAVMASAVNTGLVTVIGEIRDEARAEEFVTWHQGKYLPMVLDTGLFAGAVKLVWDPPGPRGLYVILYYIDAPSPSDVYAAFGEFAAGVIRRGDDFPGGDLAHRIVFQSLFRPSTGHYEFYE